MNFKKGESLKLTITDLAFGGIGVGKVSLDTGSEFVVFVPQTVPGDIVCARVTKVKKQYAEAEIESIEQKSVSRIAPRCRHFGICGGCSLQFLSYANQLKWKGKMVADALEKIGGFNHISVQPIIGCADPWFYRNKMEYSFGSHNNTLVLGLHVGKKFYDIFDLHECFLQSPLSVEIAHAVKEWAVQQKLPPYDSRTQSGLLRNLVVREGKNTGEVLVNLVICGSEFSCDKEFAQWIRRKFSHVTSVYRTGVMVRRGQRTVIKEHFLSGKPTLTETLTLPQGSLRFEILPQAFFQPNTKQAEVLYGKILEFAAPKRGETVLDLFCGTGTIGICFAKLGCHVIGVDLNESAIENARQNAAQNGLTTIEFHSQNIHDFLLRLDSLLAPLPSLLITDPPRAGIAPKALEKILQLRIPRWIYVSCNPATLSRDLKLAVESGYRLQKIQPIDMFPQTYHVESVCLLTYNI